jgi:hypothetical protein
MVTVAPRIALRCSSVTTPWIDPVVDCANAGAAPTRTPKATDAKASHLDMTLFLHGHRGQR